ncbi:unnamed protein product [Taenia asiatica]|uniref:AAA domain-containing protein n=1 Tax=Taenia asiatica TaxID=60517 RepID=A0A0R3VYC7_TAEAS|nr:unnamed protein product [Taenia asiatica]
MDTSKEERLSLQDDKSGLNDFGLRQSKRRKSSKEENCTNVSCGVEIQSLRDISLTGTPLLDAANGVSLSANFVKSADGLARISRKPTKSRRESCISKPFGRDSPRIPLRSSIKNTKSPENEIDLIMTGPCCNLKIEPKMWTDEYSPTSVSEMVLHSGDVAPLLEWMRLWDIDLQTACVKSPSHVSRCFFIPQVFELNPSSCRSGKEVMAQCLPVMVSQHVSTESLSASSSVSDLPKVLAPSSCKMRFQSRKLTCDPFFITQRRSFSQNASRLDSVKRDAPEGLRLIKKSLILFDDVDVLFDTDRGFWHAVGKLLQMGRRPIFFTASDPSVLREIPVSHQTCKLLPLTSSALVKPILQRICDSRGLILTDSLMLALTRRENEDCNFDIPGHIFCTARELVSSREFSNIRRSIVRLQWITGSGDQYLDRDGTKMSSYDVISAYNSTFYRLFSLSFVIPWTLSQDIAKSASDEFELVFASDAEKSSVPEERGNRMETSIIKLPLVQCKKLSADVLSELSRATELQALLDMCSTVSGRNEISRGIESLPLNITSSPNLMTVFGDFCSPPLSGIDPVGMCGTFACEEEWRRLLHLTTLHNLTRLEEELLALPADAASQAFGSYVSERSTEDSFS